MNVNRTLLAVAAVAMCSSVARAEDKPVTVVFQNGLDGYKGGSCDTRSPKGIKLTEDKKRTIDEWTENQIKLGRANREAILDEYNSYRHLVKFDGLDARIPPGKVKVLSAEMTFYYFDEWWSMTTYNIVLERCLDGDKDHIADKADAEMVLKGDRFPEKEKTLRPSYVTWKLDPATVQKWIDDPSSNHGYVFRIKSMTHDPKDGGWGLWFRGFNWSAVKERPALKITYVPLENLPPFAPTFASRLDGIRAGTEHVVRWTTPDPPDANGDKIHFELEYADNASAGDKAEWKPLAADIPGEARDYAWDTSKLAAGDAFCLRIRAVDDKRAASPWTRSEGAFTVVTKKVPFQIGIESPIRKRPREEPYRGPLWNDARIELARGEHEAVQVFISGVGRDLKNLCAAVGDLKSADGKAVLSKDNVTTNFVGFVHCVSPEKYTPEGSGLWPDPLLNIKQADVPAGKVQPIWVSVFAPSGTPAGDYTGAITLTADGVDPVAVPLKVHVFNFDLPKRPAFSTMTLDGGPRAKFYGVKEGTPEYDKLKEMYFDFLCKHRLPPGGYAMKAWGWLKPGYPAKANADGAWDFSEAEKWGKFLFDRGMTTFVAAGFVKLGKYGFPKEYSSEYRADFKKFMAAYCDFLKSKGWLKDAVVYNIDEAPSSMWDACKENYRRTKEVSKDLTVFQCLNDPKGVEALTGFADVWDVNISQFNQGAAPKRLAAGDRTWWCVCVWPADHPNLLLDYPVMDARIIGWLSWKMGVQGFEYWDTDAWGPCVKSLGDKKCVDEVESRWQANSFTSHNGEGYLVYPGPDNTLLSSIRFEALRDGFEDYEYLALLKIRLEGKTGPAADEARKLLDLSDDLCKKDLSYTSNPKLVLDTRHRIAEAIEKLGK